MPLTFVDKKKHWPPPKAVQYLLAILALLAAIAVLSIWLYARFIYKPDDLVIDKTPEAENSLPDAAYCLVIIEDPGYERFTLIKTDPAGETITAMPIAADLNTANGTLAAILQKNGAARTVQAVATTLDVPVTQFLSYSIADIQELLNEVGENLQFTLAEEVAYRDENGATVRLLNEKRALTPKQITALLLHTEWDDPQNGINLAADLAAAIINQFLLPKYNLLGNFRLLANHAQTQLRIDNYNAYLSGWEHLASVNTGALAKRIDPYEVSP